MIPILTMYLAALILTSATSGKSNAAFAYMYLSVLHIAAYSVLYVIT